MKISGPQVSAARELLKITQAELADAVGVSLQTIFRFEAGKHEPYPATEAKIKEELERRGIEFCNGDGAGVRINYAKAAEFARQPQQPRDKTGR